MRRTMMIVIAVALLSSCTKEQGESLTLKECSALLREASDRLPDVAVHLVGT